MQRSRSRNELGVFTEQKGSQNGPVLDCGKWDRMRVNGGGGRGLGRCGGRAQFPGPCEPLEEV